MRKSFSKVVGAALLLVLAGCGGVGTTPTGTDPGIVELAGALGNRYVPAGTTSEEIESVRAPLR